MQTPGIPALGSQEWERTAETRPDPPPPSSGKPIPVSLTEEDSVEFSSLAQAIAEENRQSILRPDQADMAVEWLLQVSIQKPEEVLNAHASLGSDRLMDLLNEAFAEDE